MLIILQHLFLFSSNAKKFKNP